MLEEIGRRLTATKAWRWLPGMLTLGGDRVKSVTSDGEVFLDRGFVTLNVANNWTVAYPPLDRGDFPNVSDPATQGAMLEALYRSTGFIPQLLFSPAYKSWVLSFDDFTGENLPPVWLGESREDLFLEVFEGIESREIF